LASKSEKRIEDFDLGVQAVGISHQAPATLREVTQKFVIVKISKIACSGSSNSVPGDADILDINEIVGRQEGSVFLSEANEFVRVVHSADVKPCRWIDGR